MNAIQSLGNAVLLVTGGSGFIGTNLLDRLAPMAGRIVNLDREPPLKDVHRRHWIECDILNRTAVLDAFRRSSPTHVINLAAQTDMEGQAVRDYRTNTDGVANVLAAVRAATRVERTIWVSSQFVYGPGRGLPSGPDEYRPHTVYGESKARGERLVREAELDCVWTIVRPTNVWGPWHPRYPTEFWAILKKGLYVHPGHARVIRCYGYVGNVVDQMIRILTAAADEVDGRVLYLGDRPVNLRTWCDAFSVALTGRRVRVVPRWMVRMLGRLGDLLRWVGIGFPLFTSRVESMTVDYPTPMEATFETLGAPPLSLEEGVEETVRWLRDQSEFCHRGA